ncbi:GLUG motif-containing protein, partial [Halarcobacter ebronensis]|uniref:GLUG motif-containing protein n=1 Tax=Halarcobacter ebronensis TaxID=1462615 RepID=UPI0013E928A1
IGGLVGNSFGTIKNSYATGKVTATTDFVGGLIGNNRGNISYAYYDKTLSQGMPDEMFFGKTTAELQDINTFKNDYSNWDIVEDSTLKKGTPVLSCQDGKDGDTKPIWLIGTKVTSKPIIDKPATETPNKQIDKVITTIVNKEALKVPTVPKVTTTPNSYKNVNVSFSVGENKQIVSKPIEDQETKRVTLSEAKQMQQEVTGET